MTEDSSANPTPMQTDTSTERSRWSPVKAMMRDAAGVRLSAQASDRWLDRPREVLAELSLAKFAAKMIGTDARVLHVGCGEGLSTWMLAVECGSAKGIDREAAAIETANANWPDELIAFERIDQLPLGDGTFDGVFVGDAEAWVKDGDDEDAQMFVNALEPYLHPHGTLIVGIKAAEAGSDEIGNLWRAVLTNAFYHVMAFSMSGESVLIGQRGGADRLVLLACGKRAGEANDG